MSVADTRRVDLDTAAARWQVAKEHAEYIRWRAEQLVQTDNLIGERLNSKAAELEGIRFDAEGDGSDRIIQAVDFKEAPPDEETDGDGGPQPKEPHPNYPDRSTDGKYRDGNSGRDGQWEEKIALDKYERETQVPIIRQQVRATHPLAFNRDGSPQWRYYDGLQPTGLPGEYIGIEAKRDGVKVRPPQSIFDALVTPESPATAILNGQEIKIVDTQVVYPELIPQPDPTAKPPEVSSRGTPGLPGGVPGAVIDGSTGGSGGAHTGGTVVGDPPVLPNWGTPVSPEELAESEDPILGNLGEIIEAFTPPDPNDPKNTA